LITKTSPFYDNGSVKHFLFAVIEYALYESNTSGDVYSQQCVRLINGLTDTGCTVYVSIHEEGNRARKEIKGIPDLTLYVKDTTNQQKAVLLC